MNNLKDILISLHQGSPLDLELQENQTGELIPVESLYFLDGAWMISQLNCWSSLDYGFGTCRCISHPAYRDYKINRKEALSHIRSFLRKQNKDTQARNDEIIWLELSIKYFDEHIAV